MKLTKLGWVGATALGSLLALSCVAQAQEKKDANPAAPATPAIPAAPGTPAAPGAPIAPADIRVRRVEARLRALSQTLSLNDEQKGKIKPILEEEMKKLEDLQQDKAIAPEDRMKKLREIREASQAKIKPILSADQQQKMELRQRPTRRAEIPAAPAAPTK